MSRDEFMNQLQCLLSDLPADEREEALRYYQDYFDDAGVSEESRIIEELGTPEKVAKLIKGNLYNKYAGEAGEYTERGYYNPYDSDDKNPNKVSRMNGTMNDSVNLQDKPIDKDRTKTLLIVALVVLSSPLWISAIGAVFGITIGIFGALFGITVGFGAGSLGLLIGAITLIAVGIGQLFVSAPTGIVMIGAGFILFALGLIFLFLVIVVIGKLIPAIARAITSLFNKFYHKNRRASA